MATKKRLKMVYVVIIRPFQEQKIKTVRVHGSHAGAFVDMRTDAQKSYKKLLDAGAAPMPLECKGDRVAIYDSRRRILYEGEIVESIYSEDAV